MGKIENSTKALVTYLSTFAKTYNARILPQTNPVFPNICFNGENRAFAEHFIQPLTIYTKSTSYKQARGIADLIADDIGEGGKLLKGSWGSMAIYKGSPFCQDKKDEDGTIRAVYVNLEIVIF